MSGPKVEESSNYDNYMEADARKNDTYSIGLDKFFDEPLPVVLQDMTKAKSSLESDVWKAIKVHFRNLEDVVDFCTELNQMLPNKSAYYPLIDPSLSLFGLDEVDDVPITIDASKLSSKPKNMDIDITEDDKEWREHWVGMPEFVQDDHKPYRTITMKFRRKEDYNNFSTKISQDITERTKSMWHPKLNVTKNLKLRWVQREDELSTRSDALPEHPMYIVSKGRADTMITSRSFARMQVPHYIVIEPQDEADYEKALDNFNIRKYVTLLVAPFSNHGDGPGRARNWAWDHSLTIGATSHWVFDDNISDFYRLHKNERIRFESGVGFKVMEDFVNRYDNIYIAGPQYRFFVAPDQPYPAYVANTRIYSALLIRNDCKHRWRGRYNEDTDICLRVMKDGDVCLQFNAFLQGKCATQTVAGGNTAEFYHAENVENEEFKESGYNTEGTVNKSQMLVDMHPDVARLVWRYGRWHHWVDYGPFKGNKLKMRTDFHLDLENDINDYNMVLDRDFDYKIS
jgi:hypothetical protein|tara:strand:+ start:294 stop:1832 length:1539 start_codon:yes stop_codon:yes gene_type:complete